MGNRLKVNLSACTGCKVCSIICVLAHEGYLDFSHARIRIEKNVPDLQSPVFKPRVCMMCIHAKCIDVCPTGALYMDDLTLQVILDSSQCTGCGLCIEACPFNAIWINEVTNKAIKCDLCDGDPICIKYCSPNALIFHFGS